METALTTRKPRSVKATAPRIEELTESFIASQDVRESSRALYRRTLKQYFNWISRGGYNLSQITRVEILRYKEELMGSGMSPLSVGSYITVVRKFYEWAEALKYYPNVARGIKSPKRKQEFKKQPLSPLQSSDLLKYYQGRALRDYAIVGLLLRTGLRTIEIIRASVEDITYREGKRVLLIQGKGRDSKDELVVLTDKTYLPISEYLATRGKVKAGEPLFTSVSNNSQGERLSTRTISQIAKEGLKAIGLDGREFTAHSLRHTTIVNLRRAGATPEQAQGVARHRSIATTQIYDSYFRQENRIKNSPEELLDSVF